jgi:hypothetical protein
MRALVHGQEHYELDMEIYPGNSGGPVLLATGEVIGVVDCGLRGKERMSFCIPASVLSTSVLAQALGGAAGAARADSQHRALVAFHRLDELNGIYARGMSLYAQHLRTARWAGDPMGVSNLLGQVLTEVGAKAQLPDLLAEVERIRADQNLIETTRANLVAYWDNIARMNKELRQSGIDYDEFVYMANALRARHEQIKKNLASALAPD